VVWPYVRFTLSYRDVKDLLAERGWTSRMRPFGDGSRPLFARELARGGLRPPSLWHLDEMTVIFAGEQFWLCACRPPRGDVLDLLGHDAATRPQPRG
jgi:transposase-like protein